MKAECVMNIRASFCPVYPCFDSLSEEELALANRFKGARQAQFLAGRRAGRLLTGGPILSDEDGMPIFPTGWTGSIAHTAHLAVAVATVAGPFTIGVDLENISPERRAVEELVIHEADTFPQGWEGLLRVFCLKEALYKAIYPHVRTHVDFQEVVVHTGMDGPASFTLCLDSGRVFKAKGGSRRLNGAMFAWAWVMS
jgi:enterobactin synthetase component D